MLWVYDHYKYFYSYSAGGRLQSSESDVCNNSRRGCLLPVIYQTRFTVLTKLALYCITMYYVLEILQPLHGDVGGGGGLAMLGECAFY